MIIIPMAGLSSRFFDAGYEKPKYMLELQGQSVFATAVKSFEKYFQTQAFLFVVRDIYGTADFVKQQAKAIGIKDFHIFVLNQTTRGQAETVALSITDIDNSEELTIFNIDTFRPSFSFPDICKKSDGYLEVFEGSGDNWSFVKPQSDSSTKIIKTAEKNPISNLCCTGLYHFASKNLFLQAFNYYCSIPQTQWDKNELYVAPLYNFLIQKQYNIHYHLIHRDEVIFCGTPDEYQALLSR